MNREKGIESGEMAIHVIAVFIQTIFSKLKVVKDKTRCFFISIL